MRSLRTPFLALAALVLGLASASEAAAATRLWATVNVCDTELRPDTLGIRANVPGNGTGQRLYMRFEAQYYDAVNGVYLPSGSSTRFIPAGSARSRSTQKGYLFEFGAPPPGTEITLRGLVSFQWRARRNGRLVVVRRARRVTTSGHRGVEHGDPRGTSEATCALRG